MKTIINSIVAVGLLGLLFGCTRQPVVEPAAVLTGGRLEITDFTIAGQLGKTVIDFDNSQVYVYVPYNANLANLMVTKAWASSQGSIMYMGNPLAEGMNYNFTTPLNVQVVKGDGQKNWTITVIPFTVTTFDADGVSEWVDFFGGLSPIIDPSTRTISFDYSNFYQSGTPSSVKILYTLPIRMTGNIPSETDVDLRQPLMLTLSTPGGYSEEWKVKGAHQVILVEESFPLASDPTLGNGKRAGWNFEQLNYVENYAANKAQADLAAAINAGTYGTAGGFDFAMTTALNPTLFAYYGNDPAANLFYNLADKDNAKKFFDTKFTANMAYKRLIQNVAAGEVYVAKTSNGDYVLIKISVSKEYFGVGSYNYFLFTYRKLN